MRLTIQRSTGISAMMTNLEMEAPKRNRASWGRSIDYSGNATEALPGVECPGRNLIIPPLGRDVITHVGPPSNGCGLMSRRPVAASTFRGGMRFRQLFLMVLSRQNWNT